MRNGLIGNAESSKKFRRQFFLGYFFEAVPECRKAVQRAFLESRNSEAKSMCGIPLDGRRSTHANAFVRNCVSVRFMDMFGDSSNQFDAIRKQTKRAS